MTKRAPPTVRFLRGLTDREQFKALPDGELMARYAAGNESAFEALVGRHGAMVLQVCRSFLRNEADAEDAFQVTFFVLARQARSVRKAGSLGSWLYGVAYHTALKSRRAAATRRRHEAQAVAASMTGPPDLSWGEAQEIFYEELAALPEKYRAPLVLCYLEGRRQDEAETLLGLPEGRLRGLVERARGRLRSRLVRRGLGPGAVFFAVLGSSAASPAPPAALVLRVVGTVTSRASGPGPVGVPARFASLTEGVIRTMTTRKLRIVSSLLAAVTVVGLTGYLYAGRGEPAVPAPAVRGTPMFTFKREQPEKGIPVAEAKPVVVGEKAMINRLAWDAKGETVVTVGAAFEVAEIAITGQDPLKVLLPSSTIKLRDAKTGELKQALGEEKGIHIGNLTLSPDRKTAVITAIKFTDEDGKAFGGSRGTEVRLMDAEKWELKRKVDSDGLDAPVKPLVHAVAFSPDGKTLAMGGASPRVKGGCFLKLWDVQKEKLIGGTKKTEEADVGSGFPEAVTSLAFSPDGKLLAAGCMDDKLRLFDGRTGELKKVWDDDCTSAWWVVFSPDGKTLLSQSRDKTVKVWDVQEAKVLRTLQGNKASVMTAAFSPDGKLFATGGIVRENDKVTGGEVILWDAQTGDLKHTFPGLTVPVSTLSFSPDGKTLAVAGGTSGDLKDGGKTTGEIKLFPLESLTPKGGK